MTQSMKTGLLLAGLRINFNQRAPLAGFITPCVAVWDRSGLIQTVTHYHILYGVVEKRVKKEITRVAFVVQHS